MSENNKGFREKEVLERRAVCKKIFLARKSVSNGVPYQEVAAVSCSEAAPVALANPPILLQHIISFL